MQSLEFYYLQSEIDYRRERMTGGPRSPFRRSPTRPRNRIRRQRASAVA